MIGQQITTFQTHGGGMRIYLSFFTFPNKQLDVGNRSTAGRTGERRAVFIRVLLHMAIPGRGALNRQRWKNKERHKENENTNVSPKPSTHNARTTMREPYVMAIIQNAQTKSPVTKMPDALFHDPDEQHRSALGQQNRRPSIHHMSKYPQNSQSKTTIMTEYKTK